VYKPSGCSWTSIRGHKNIVSLLMLLFFIYFKMFFHLFISFYFGNLNEWLFVGIEKLHYNQCFSVNSLLLPSPPFLLSCSYCSVGMFSLACWVKRAQCRRWNDFLSPPSCFVLWGNYKRYCMSQSTPHIGILVPESEHCYFVASWWCTPLRHPPKVTIYQ
jgi:hypothetical protein